MLRRSYLLPRLILADHTNAVELPARHLVGILDRRREAGREDVHLIILVLQ